MKSPAMKAVKVLNSPIPEINKSIESIFPAGVTG